MRVAIDASTEESVRFGLQVARWKGTELPESNAMVKALWEMNVDLLRVEVPATATTAQRALQQLSLPNALHYVALTSGMRLNPHMKFDGLPDSFQYRPYDPDSERSTLFEVAKACMVDIADDYLEDPFLEALIPKTKLIESHAEFATTFSPKLFPNRKAYMGHSEAGIYGFFLLEYAHPIATAVMGGVVPEFRRRGIGLEGYAKIIRDDLLPNGFTEFRVQIHLQNLANQRTAAMGGQGMLPAQAHFRYNVLPMIGKLKSQGSILLETTGNSAAEAIAAICAAGNLRYSTGGQHDFQEVSGGHRLFAAPVITTATGEQQWAYAWLGANEQPSAVGFVRGKS